MNMEKSQIFSLKSAKEKFAASPRPTEIVPGVTKLSELVFSKGSLQLRYYEPGNIDHQVPHDQEELYIVISGTAELDHGGRKICCNPGDSIFVSKDEIHKFVNISNDFSVWVIYFNA